MSAVLAMLHDRKRAQRGSVLSGVLIIVMFLSIVAGALMTELTTNFLLSRTLVNRVGNQATVNSAIELALDTLQKAPLTTACPTLTPVSLNGRTAVPTYIRCALVVDNGSLPAVRQIPSAVPFEVDGSYVSLPGLLPGRADEYLVADSAGTLFAYPFGQTSGWSYPVGGTPTGSPVAMAGGNGEVSNLVPVSYPSPVNYAVALLNEATPGQRPAFNCNMAANAAVTAGPAASRNARRSAYFGDASGTLFVYDASAGGSCSFRDKSLVSGGQPVVAGPVVFAGSNSRTDDLYVVASDGGSSELVQFAYNSNSTNLSLVSSLALPAANAVGMAADNNTVPARIAITFAGGQVSLVAISSGYGMSLLPGTGSVPGGRVADAAGWCQQCLGGAGVIGVGGQGGLYLFDTSLNLYGSFTGPPIHTTPAADAGGDWFIAGDDGNLNEVQRPATQTAMVLAKSFPSATAPISSSPVMHTCAVGLCIYFAAMDSSAYLVPLDSRDAVITACLTASPPTCSGDNPRLWTAVEVGDAVSAQTVHVGGWSYYSP